MERSSFGADQQLMDARAVKYIAKVEGVRELGLVGAAELSWWRDFLGPEGFEPVEVDGRAQVVVTGMDSKWKGVAFRELAVMVAAREESGSGEMVFFMAGAFNSSRLFSGFEKWWFHTPYQHRADLHVALGDACVFRLGEEPAADVLAEMGAREASEVAGPVEEMGYTGALFVPTGGDRNLRRWFMIDCHGLTSTFDFDAKRDRFELGTECADPTLAGLRASKFVGVQWHVRRDAWHARSKTFQVRR